MSNDSFEEYRRLIMANFERNDKAISDIEARHSEFKSALYKKLQDDKDKAREERQKLKDKIQDQRWINILLAIGGGAGGAKLLDLAMKVVLG